MQRIERFLFKGVGGIIFLFATNIVLFFFDKAIPITLINILFSFCFSYLAVFILLIITLLNF